MPFAWGDRNVKTIGHADISELVIQLHERGLSSKYRFDIISVLKSFYRWLHRTGEIRINQIPSFPDIKYSMKYRKIVSKDIQTDILNEVHQLTWGYNPRIYIYRYPVPMDLHKCAARRAYSG